MSCRIGMAKAANVQDRIKHWKKEEGYTKDEILHRRKTYNEATELEEDEAAIRGCKNKAGGVKDKDRDWCVYHVYN